MVWTNTAHHPSLQVLVGARLSDILQAWLELSPKVTHSEGVSPFTAASALYAWLKLKEGHFEVM